MQRDRWFWISLARLWTGWHRALFVVHPDTIVHWQRRRFRAYWARLSNQGGKPGRPPVIADPGHDPTTAVANLENLP